MKRKFIGIAILSALILSCTGCNTATTAENSLENNTSSNSVSDVEDEQEIAKAEVTEATEAVSDSGAASSGGGISYDRGDYKAVDEVKKDENKDIIYDNLRLVPAPNAEPTHPDINFGLVKGGYDDTEFDVFECDVETFETLVNRASSTSAIKHNTDDFYFYGVPFITSECYLELITPQDTITRCNTTSKDVLYPCDIKGIAVEDSNAFFFYNDITIGTPETRVEEALGKGIIGCTYVDTNDYDREKRTVIYKSAATTMVIIYLDGKNIAGEPVGAVDKIFVLKND